MHSLQAHKLVLVFFVMLVAVCGCNEGDGAPSLVSDFPGDNGTESAPDHSNPTATAPLTPAITRTPVKATPTESGPKRPATIEVMDGDGQNGMLGFLLPHRIKVQAKDEQGKPLAFIQLSVEHRSGPSVWVEPAVIQTDNTGVAFIGIRGGKSDPGPGTVAVHASASFTGEAIVSYNLARPTIVVAGPAGPLAYGKAYAVKISIDGDGNPSTVDYEPERLNPVRFAIESEGAQVSHTLLQTPSPDGTTPTFLVVPMVLDGYAAINVGLATDPEVEVGGKVWEVATPANTTRTISLAPFTDHTEPVRLHVKPNLDFFPEGLDGFPSLPSLLSAQLVDDAGTVYGAQVTSAKVNDCSPITSRPLPFGYSVPAGTGRLGEYRSTEPGFSNSIEVTPNTDVGFTPYEDGPWAVTVIYGNQVRDVDARTLQSPSTGNCYREDSFPNIGVRDFTFLVHQPAIGLSLIDSSQVDRVFAVAEVDRELRDGDMLLLKVSRALFKNGTQQGLDAIASAKLRVYGPNGVARYELPVPGFYYPGSGLAEFDQYPEGWHGSRIAIGGADAPSADYLPVQPGDWIEITFGGASATAHVTGGDVLLQGP